MPKCGSIIKICALLFGLLTLSGMSNCQTPTYGEQSGNGASGNAEGDSSGGSSGGGY